MISSVTRHAPLVWNFAQRDLRARYKRSLLGWLWSLINPLSTILTYSLVFGVFFRVEPPVAGNGTLESFALYLFSGLVVWTFFSSNLNGAMDWLQSVGELRRKAVFPLEAAIFGGAVALSVQTLLEAAVLVAVLIVVSNASWTMVLLPLILLCAGLFGLGIGFFVAIFNARYRDVRHFVTIALQLGFFLVPIIYTIDIIPTRAYGLPIRRMVELNPLSSFIGASRDLVYHLQVPSLSRWLAVLGYSLTLFCLGWWFFSVKSVDLSEEL